MKRKLLKCLFFLIVFIAFEASAQDKTITGMVTAKDDGLPIPGVSIKLKGTNRGVVTDAKGRYSISVPSTEKDFLVYSFVGFKTKEISTLSRTIDVTLESNANTLDEVVIAAGGIKRAAREQGYATTRIDAEALTAGKSPTIAGGLAGKVAGLQINAVGTGVNPAYRLVLRGDRSITGNNQALIVLDGAVVPNELLGNINPDDVEDLTVLNGASGAALYGSDASNGVLIITTKRGKKGTPVIKLSNTTAIEKISFYPELQNRFGSGTDDYPVAYEPIENQQYGPAFDGVSRPIGRINQFGQTQMVPYSATRDKYDFWDTGISNQTDFSLSSGDEKSSTYISAQYLNGKGTTPKDEYDRIAFRFNGDRNITKNFSAKYNISFTQNKYDTTPNTSSIYDNLLNTPAQVPLLSYTDWQDLTSWANPNNYYNDYYRNPYFAIDNARQKQKNDYITGLVELNYKVNDWISFIARASLSNRYYESKTATDGFTYTDFVLGSGSSKANFASSVSDRLFQNSNFNSDFIANIKKDIKDFSINFLAGANLKSFTYKTMSSSGSGLQVPYLYNLGNITGTPTASESNENTRRYGVWGDVTVGYKKYLFLHVTGRNDWVSILAPANRSFFYPAADVSFIPTDAFDFLKNSKWLDYWKIRGGISKVGNVNVDTYALLSTFGSQTGYNYGTGYTPSSLIVSPDLKPEITNGYEFGTDFRMFKGRIDGTVTYYHTSSTGQAINAGIAASSGFTSYLLNAGELENTGLESVLHFTPINKGNWRLVVGGNYTHNVNKLLSLTPGLTRIGVSGSGTIYGDTFVQTYPIIIGSDYVRDSEGRVVVDRNTGNPVGTTTGNVLGNTQPKNRLGLDFNLSWKGLTLSGLFEYRGDFVQYTSAGSTFDFSGSSIRSVYYNRERFVFPNSSYLDAATGNYVANNNITVSAANSGFWSSSQFRGTTSNYVYSGDYWKLRELALSYKIPSTALKYIKFIKTATVSAQGRNLFIWLPKSNTWGDPDVSSNGSDSNAVGITSLSQTPPTRYFGGTVSLTF
ncbi:SusC/RagA family TonB-linked outer membrane protein [Pedobacter sp. Leaf194]|uniref:SusC/RagA family TonB-linked outer membrane protein n=1 Tax=Pedobacter sp. Leaf194 TaxID=1736297 RepID=UPI000A7AACA9|nr:SusC/RagA family TonB-linked outer membrane protein [Pedobacter sp. Leaf194]